MELLLVEANRSLARSLRIGLEEEGFAVHAVPDPDQARHLLSVRDFAIIIADIATERAQAVLEEWRQAHITTPILVLADPGSPLEQFTTLDLGTGAFLAKPFDFDALLNQLAILTNHSAHIRNGRIDDSGRKA